MTDSDGSNNTDDNREPHEPPIHAVPAERMEEIADVDGRLVYHEQPPEKLWMKVDTGEAIIEFTIDDPDILNRIHKVLYGGYIPSHLSKVLGLDVIECEMLDHDDINRPQ